MTNLKKKRIVIKDRKKFINRIFFLIIIILIIVIICMMFGNKKISKDMNISQLNVNKYSKQIKEEYEKDNENLEKVNLFISTQNNLQTDIYNYFYSTNLEEDNLSKQKYVNEKLKKQNLSGISNVDLKYWNGTWFCDEYGNVKFKFTNSKIEPSWINNDRLDGYIELNI